MTNHHSPHECAFACAVPLTPDRFRAASRETDYARRFKSLVTPLSKLEIAQALAAAGSLGARMVYDSNLEDFLDALITHRAVTLMAHHVEEEGKVEFANADLADAVVERLTIDDDITLHFNVCRYAPLAEEIKRARPRIRWIANSGPLRVESSLLRYCDAIALLARDRISYSDAYREVSLSWMKRLVP